MVQSKYILGLLTIIAVMVSGCINSNEPTQKTQPIISPTPIPTKEVNIDAQRMDEARVININAQQIIVDENEVREALGSNWNISQDLSVGTISELNPISSVSKVYDSGKITNIKGGSIEDHAMIWVIVYGSQNEANKEYLNQLNRRCCDTPRENITLGDFGSMYVSNRLIDIYFVKNNIVSFFSFNRAWGNPDKLSEDEKNNAIDLVKSYELAKIQDAKISKILEMIK